MSTTTTRRDYIGAADTAKLIRQALKESFPDVKFSVRSETYSMGASVNVRWTDGPTEKQVAAVAKAFQGGYFDGMIDYAGSVFHSLDGRPVRFQADHVFCTRAYSPAAVEAAIMRAMTTYRELAAEPWPGVYLHQDGTAWVDRTTGTTIGKVWIERERCYADAAIMQIAAEVSRATPQPSATLKRVRCTGDDGYSRSMGTMR
jgi:hypothetical protein